MVGSKEDRSIHVMTSIKKRLNQSSKKSKHKDPGGRYSLKWPIRGGLRPKGFFFSRLEGKERVGISLVEAVYEGVGKSVISVSERTKKGTRRILWM